VAAREDPTTMKERVRWLHL